MSEFFQQGPQLTNTYTGHRWLKAYLRHRLPADAFAEMDRELQEFGARCAGPYLALAKQAEREKPVHVPFDAFGQRVDELRVSSAWQELQNISAREGLVAIGYERDSREFSRFHQFAKLFLFHPSSAFFTCPLAMADGAARVLELHSAQDATFAQAFRHLTARDPQKFWTSGQWMTEKTGGSDVSETSTQVRMENGRARLYGTKWFSSATTSQMALALGRTSASEAGSRGLTLFFVKTYLPSGQLNHLRILRLKDKLGTWALPTAELSLEGTYAHAIGELGSGIKTVATMLNITRLYNSICSLGQSARGLELMRDYSHRRQVFGKSLSEQPLHYTTFAALEMEHLAGFLLTFELVALLGREECGVATEDERELLRLLTPICKLFTARSAIDTASQVIEGFGGVGYIEDTGLPGHLRDAQVFPIWEGATNVLALDVLRVLQKGKALAALQKQFAFLAPAKLDDILKNFEHKVKVWSQSGADAQVASARGLAFYIARLYSLALLIHWSEQESPARRSELQMWIEAYRRDFLGDWRLIDAANCAQASQLWKSQLED